MIHLKLRQFLFVYLSLTAFAFIASSQEATIVGTITDPTGAPVPNVAISITHAETGQVRHVATGDSGQYVVPDLQIGHYTVRAHRL